MEQPDVVFSVEQIRCGEAEASSPEDICNSDPDSEDAGSNPSSAVELFFQLKEKPEELLQLAPEAGDAIVPLTGGETHKHIYIYT